MTSPQTSSAPTGDTPPVDPSSGGSSGGQVSSAWRGIQGMNRWALLGIVAVILLLVWYFYVHRNQTATQGENTSDDWENRARSLLASRGYPQGQIDSAMNHYLHGGQMSTQDMALIAVAIRELGTPDIPNPAPSSSVNSGQDPWTNPGPAVPSGTQQNSSSNALADSSNTGVAYVYVVSTGFGWTSSLRGISAQLYGSANYAASLLQYNPELQSVSDRIPLGVRVKAPRTINV